MINVLLGACGGGSPVLTERREVILEATVRICSLLLPFQPRKIIRKRGRRKTIPQEFHSFAVLTASYQNYVTVYHSIVYPCHCGFWVFYVQVYSLNTKQITWLFVSHHTGSKEFLDRMPCILHPMPWATQPSYTWGKHTDHRLRFGLQRSQPWHEQEQVGTEVGLFLWASGKQVIQHEQLHWTLTGRLTRVLSEEPRQPTDLRFQAADLT